MNEKELLTKKLFLSIHFCEGITVTEYDFLVNFNDF